MRMVFLLLLFSSLMYGRNPKVCDSIIVNGVKAMHAKEHGKSLELLTEAKTMAKENDWNPQLFLALNNIGANYYAMMDYGEALNYYLEAYTLAIKELDDLQEMIVLNNIAILYLKDKDYGKAVEYLEKAYSLAKKAKNKKKIALYAVNLGLVANENRELEKARNYLNEVLKLEKENPEVILEAKIALADNHYLQKELEEAKKLATELLEEVEAKQLHEHRLNLLLILSKTHESESNLSLAVTYAKEALTKPVNLESKILVYQQLADLYLTKQELPLALNAKDSLLVLNDQLHEIKNGRLYEINRVKFEIQNYQQELQRSKENFEAERKGYYQIFGGGVVVLLLVGWGFRNSRIKNKQNKLIFERSKEIISLELEQKNSANLLLEKQMKEKETLSLLEQERLKNEIESRNRKLSAKALYLSERNALIGSIIKDLAAISELKTNRSIENQINKLKNLIKTDDEWKEFTIHFEEVNNGFLTAIRTKFPQLNANEIRYLSYLYMNLNHKEIAAILHITPEACRKRKERISKKLGITDSSKLFDYLASL